MSEFCCEHAWAAAKERAWLERLNDRCDCDHNEYCGKCWPLEFRPGGKFHAYAYADDYPATPSQA